MTMVIEKAIADYTDFRIPGIVATNKGTLLRYCECRRSRSDWADIDIKVARSEDEGAHWETVLFIKSGGNTLNNPVMFVNGEQIVFLYCKNYKEIWKRVSTDDGNSFGDAERVDFESSVNFFYNVVAVGPGHGIVHNGRLLAPVWFAYNRENEKEHHPSFISTLYSDDDGITWRVGEPILQNDLVNPSECALAVTAANEILISIRHEGNSKKRGLAKSADGISAWYALCFEENLSDPVCMGSMTHRNGRIYHSNCDSMTERKNLTIKISDDNFKTCRSLLVSDIGGYSDIALLGEKICIFYEKPNTEGAFELSFEMISVEENPKD